MLDSNHKAINGSTFISHKKEKIKDKTLKDRFFMSDLEKYYKYGTIPYILFIQIFLVISTTCIILISTDDLTMFRYHIRSVDMTFSQQQTYEPSMDSQSIYILGSISELNKQIDFVLEKIFNFEDNFSHNIKLLNGDKIKLNVHYIKQYLNKSTKNPDFSIKSKDGNPLYKIGDNSKIREYLRHVKEFTIPINYQMKIYVRNRYLHLLWDTYLIFDFSNRGFFVFKTYHLFNYKKEDTWWNGHLYDNLVTEFGFLNLFIIALAVIQIYLIIKRLYEAVVALSKLKKRLSKLTYVDDEEDPILKCSEAAPFQKGKTKWEMLKLNEKRKFFNLWYFIMLIGNFFQIVSSINHIMFPILNDLNQLLVGFSCLFSWLSCAYFLEYEDRYYFFYLTIKKSVKTNYKYLLVFILVFIGFGILTSTTFNYSEKYYSNVHMSFITCFGCLLGDSLSDIWRSTFDKNPVNTIIFSIFFFLVFVAFLLKMLISITEESFDCVKMRKSYNWLEKRLSLKDYLQHEMNHRLEDHADTNHDHYMVCTGVLNILVTIEKYKDRIPEEVHKIFDKEVYLLKQRGLDQEEINKILKKEIKKFVKSEFNNSNTGNDNKNSTTNQFDIALHSRYHNKSAKIKHMLQSIELLFDQIETIFDRIHILIHVNRHKTFKNLTQHEIDQINRNVIDFTINFLNKLSEIKEHN